jgi:hypothetical protein
MVSRVAHVITLLIVLLAGRASGQFHGKEIREVADGRQFVEALGSDRTLRLTAGRIELPPSDTGVIIRDLKNLRILGSTEDDTVIVGLAGSRVLSFERCMNIDLRRLNLRLESSHPNFDGVMGFSSVTNVLIRNCSLSGVASSGLVLDRVARGTAEDCTVLNCGDGAARIVDSRNLLFKSCRFMRNQGDRGFDLRRVFDLRLVECRFSENTFKRELVGVSDSAKIVIAACTFEDDRHPRIASSTNVVPVVDKIIP